MEERLKILEMLRDGTITVSEAEDLLKVVDQVEVGVVTNDEVKLVSTKEKLKGQKPKMLHIKVVSAQGDNVNINIPVSFLKAAIASGTINNIYNKSININGVGDDLIKNTLDIDMLIECIENDYLGSLVDVTTAQGDIVEIYFE